MLRVLQTRTWIWFVTLPAHSEAVLLKCQRDTTCAQAQEGLTSLLSVCRFLAAPFCNAVPAHSHTYPHTRSHARAHSQSRAFTRAHVHTLCPQLVARSRTMRCCCGHKGSSTNISTSPTSCRGGTDCLHGGSVRPEGSALPFQRKPCMPPASPLSYTATISRNTIRAPVPWCSHCIAQIENGKAEPDLCQRAEA